jgi:hypothetical protein
VLGAVGWIGRVLCVVLPGYVGDSVDGRSAGQPADGSASRHRPASGWGEIEDVDRCAVRLLGQGLVKERKVRDRVVDSCRQKKRVSSRYCQSSFRCSPRPTSR